MSLIRKLASLNNHLSVTLPNWWRQWPSEMWTYNSGLWEVCAAFVQGDE